MPLKNSQYDILMRAYNRRQLENRHEQKLRVEHAYSLSPRLKQIDEEISTFSASRARSRIMGKEKDSEILKNTIQQRKEERITILKSLNLPLDYMEMHYHCPDCKDTGYIGAQKCHCFQQAAVNLLYDQSNIRDILQKENFETFSLNYYSPNYDATLGQSTQNYMKSVLERCLNFVRNYPESLQKENFETFSLNYYSPNYDATLGQSTQNYMKSVLERCLNFVRNYPESGQNIMFTGTTGVGKTFLSNCIAKAMIEQCYSVVYLTATELFNIFSRGCFSYEEEASDEIDHYILDSDILIIDDLGTERANSFTVSKLFYCINERYGRKKGTIISTNLKPGEIRDLYSERIASRILSNYEIITLFGDDIRIIKKFGKA